MPEEGLEPPDTGIMLASPRQARKQRLLERVLGFGHRAEHPVAVGVGEARAVRVASDCAHGLIVGEELLDYLPPDRAGGSGDEDHPPDVALTSRSDLPMTSRASMRRCASAASSSG
jgi:hypothetical protein